ncbi:hypothetical protein BGZ57DRAFT_858122 [Hyaloscypha finlandica]|nr:hypothetical protein BGZ57DRAFT_858122 [Hyaloscypha finlandica]
MPLTNTIWPEAPAPKPVKDWLETLFALLDSKDISAPENAAALYTEDAVVYGMAGKAVGTSEIIQARENSWAHMDSRKHEVLRVYSSNNDFSDLLLIGKLSAKFKNGREVTDEFIVRLVFRGDTTVNPKGSLYQIWADSAPWLKAIHGN